MKKRKMPAHIVLPNGMWRFVKAGAKKAKSRVKSIRVKTKRKRGVYMAKKRHSRRSSGFGGLRLGRVLEILG